MRLFIAVDLDNEGYFNEIQAKLDSEDAKINFTKAYHLTLKFLGEVSEEKVSDVKEALGRLKFDKFKIKTTKIGVFPSQNFIRVMWLGLEPENKIIELKNNVDECLTNLFGKEKRFKPHITLARVKFIKDRPKFIEDLKKIEFEEKEFDIESVKLIKSELTSEGSVYETLIEVPKQ